MKNHRWFPFFFTLAFLSTASTILSALPIDSFDFTTNELPTCLHHRNVVVCRSTCLTRFCHVVHLYAGAGYTWYAQYFYFSAFPLRICAECFARISCPLHPLSGAGAEGKQLSRCIVQCSVEEKVAEKKDAVQLRRQYTGKLFGNFGKNGQAPTRARTRHMDNVCQVYACVCRKCVVRR